MDFKKISNELKKLLSNKSYYYILVSLLVMVFLYLAASTFLGSGLFKKSTNNNTPKGAYEVSGTESEISQQIANYETEQRQELKEILKKMNGVTDVEVMMHFESGEIKVPAVNSNTKNYDIQEEDGSGATRTTKQEDGGSTVVMSTVDGDSEPFIVKTYKPRITGIVIVAKGAENSKLRYDIQVAVSSLYNLSLDKVNVYPMGE